MTTHAANTTCLVADIGGTNTRVALAVGADLIADTISKYKNSTHNSLQDVLTKFIAEQGHVDCAAACVAVAGPVRDGVGALTNLDWVIDRDTLKSATKAENVAILNDLQAQGHALDHLPEDKVEPVFSGPKGDDHSAKLVIGIGTGFNAAVVFDSDRERLVPPSESGHANFPIRSDADMDIARFIARSHEFPAVDDVLSGRGLERIYAWHRDVAGETGGLDAAEIMVRVGDGSNPAAVAAAKDFTRILGNVAGDLALIHLPYGGIFLVGGVARAFAAYLDQFGFRQAFRDKGRFDGFMDNFSVAIVNDDWAALIGCARHMATFLGNGELTKAT